MKIYLICTLFPFHAQKRIPSNVYTQMSHNTKFLIITFTTLLQIFCMFFNKEMTVNVSIISEKNNHGIEMFCFEKIGPLF